MFLQPSAADITARPMDTRRPVGGVCGYTLVCVSRDLPGWTSLLQQRDLIRNKQPSGQTWPDAPVRSKLAASVSSPVCLQVFVRLPGWTWPDAPAANTTAAPVVAALSAPLNGTAAAAADKATALVVHLNHLTSAFQFPPIEGLRHASASGECGDGICSVFEIQQGAFWDEATTTCEADCKLDGFCTQRQAQYLPWPIQPWSSMPTTPLLFDLYRSHGASLVRPPCAARMCFAHSFSHASTRYMVSRSRLVPPWHRHRLASIQPTRQYDCFWSCAWPQCQDIAFEWFEKHHRGYGSAEPPRGRALTS